MATTLAAAFDIPRKSRLATGAVAGLVAWAACGFTRPRSRWLFALAIGVAAGAAVAARVA